MLTASARRSLPASLRLARATVATEAEIRARRGITYDAVKAQLDARRWQRFGRVLVLHAGPLTRAETERVGLLNCGPRAVWTAFTGVATLGLKGWERDDVHVLVPGGVRIRRVPEIGLKVHYVGEWEQVRTVGTRRIHAAPDALVIGASDLPQARFACAILAAGVQQRLVTATQLEDALQRAPRTKYRASLIAAVHDIGQGAQALSEIDFARLCRRNGLPTPTRQAIRKDRHGRRRYLDAEWTRSDGLRVVVEVDGALHLAVRQWWDDQDRQNELAIDGAMVLRYPSVVVREEPLKVIRQLRRALLLP